MFQFALKMEGLFKKRSLPIFMAALMVFGLTLSIVQQAQASEKFINRGLYINSARASDNTYYVLSFQYPTASAVGSLLMQFCTNPIPSLPCDAPPGMDVSGATLSAQSGVTGYTIANSSSNMLLLSRAPLVTGLIYSSYRFDNVINPDGDTTGSTEWPGEQTNFYVRLTDYSSVDGTGSFIDYGSVSAVITPELELYTQVPPVLIFCVAAIINDDKCADTSGNFVDFGEIGPAQTYYTSSQMLAYTNGRGGYAITVTGNTFTSGIRSIPSLTTPSDSLVGVGQFGINLATNTTPAIGTDPVGTATNTVLNPNYDQPDKFLFNDGDVLVTSDFVTPTMKYTTSYILNVPADQHPGVYSTTISYVCTASF